MAKKKFRWQPRIKLVNGWWRVFWIDTSAEHRCLFTNDHVPFMVLVSQRAKAAWKFTIARNNKRAADAGL